MPSLGADMDSGTVIEWRVAAGDVVHRGDIVAVVDTDKSDIEVEVFEDGVVEQLLVDVGAEVAVGTPLATIKAVPRTTPEIAPRRAPTTPEPPATPPPPRGEPAAVGAAPGPTTTGPPPTALRRAGTGRHVVASPFARRQAADLDVDLADVTGTGPDGAVVVADVEAAALGTAPAPATSPVRERPRAASDRQQTMRRAIGDPWPGRRARSRTTTWRARSTSARSWAGSPS